MLNFKLIFTLAVLLTGYSVFYENYYDLHGIDLFYYGVEVFFKSLPLVAIILLFIHVMFGAGKEAAKGIKEAPENLKELKDIITGNDKND